MSPVCGECGAGGTGCAGGTGSASGARCACDAADLPYVPFMPVSTRRTPTARGLRRGGAATSLRLPLRVFPSERCAVNVSHRVISPSVYSAKLPVAGCWG